MNYYSLKAIFSSAKTPITLANPSESFAVAGPPTKFYIKPVFDKVIYDTEKPTVLLISAVGATGKTALAQQLSRDTQLPILNLGKHPPVGANTLTGILTTAYDVAVIGPHMVSM